MMIRSIFCNGHHLQGPFRCWYQSILKINTSAYSGPCKFCIGIQVSCEHNRVSSRTWWTQRKHFTFSIHWHRIILAGISLNMICCTCARALIIMSIAIYCMVWQHVVFLLFNRLNVISMLIQFYWVSFLNQRLMSKLYIINVVCTSFKYIYCHFIIMLANNMAPSTFTHVTEAF